MQTHTVNGAGGLDLNVVETGNADGRPILFIHGYSQNLLSWKKQLESDLGEEFRLVAMDIRGHGNSEKPTDAYDDPALWADDVQGVIDALALEGPVLVGWSYGGVIISDYVSIHGTDDIAGANYVGAVSKLGTDDALAVIGEDYLELIPGFESTDAEESVETLDTFVRRCVYGEPSPEDLYFVLGFNVVVPPYVREGLHSREVVHDDDLAAVDVPVLLTHGAEDTIVLQAAAEEHHDLLPDSERSTYAGVGHSPFWEAPERFNRELRDFVSSLG